MASTLRCDLAILGGGLAGGLIALAVAARRPAATIRLVEANDTLGGNHVWSFFGADVSRAHRPILERLVAYAWPGYDVRFPRHRRSLSEPYYSITSERFDAVLRASLPAGTVMTGRRVLAASTTAAVLADGDRIEASGVIDARGAGSAGGDLSLLDLAWQKFVGRELTLAEPHGLGRPVVMDATVPQLDGYRFVYTLPFGSRTAFVEDTYYSTAPDLDASALDARIDGYAAGQGWEVTARGRREAAALPVALGGDFEAYWRAGGRRIAKAGIRAGLFHPTTGYSLPDAVRTAALVAGASDWSGAGLHDLLHDHARRAWDDRGFYRLLDRMLFRAAEPAERYRVLERFYRLNPALIGRFYAARSTLLDKARILSGRPPVPLARAIRAIPSASPSRTLVAASAS
ncbi:lycopene beta-cyclase CrtY [Sphingomonas bacterium]|uniref:lycopene beta-cyclase CrtY n=1 Tax=Sphingomonas bacterium TaxID=1895847 RepID=UPI001577154D|nr:lycopene beta-cyclase CrtY [Sphingomonas bacterium]